MFFAISMLTFHPWGGSGNREEGLAGALESELYDADSYVGNLFDEVPQNMRNEGGRIPKSGFTEFFLGRSNLVEQAKKKVMAEQKKYIEENQNGFSPPKVSGTSEVKNLVNNALNQEVEQQTQLYRTYLGKVFDAATAMMLPRVKQDIGKHCFMYASKLAEYSTFLSAPPTVSHESAMADWTEFQKIYEDHLVNKDWTDFTSNKEAFKTTFFNKYKAEFAQLSLFENAFKEYLGALHEVGIALQPEEENLDEQRFGLLGQFVQEFYFPSFTPKDALNLL